MVECEHMHIPVIFEDSDLIVLDKPSGIVVHPFDFSSEETVLDVLKEQYPDIFLMPNHITLQDKREINLGGIVHRLDRDTSGVLLVARNPETFEDLKQQFQSQTIEKKYIGLLEGVLEKDDFRIDAPLGRNKKDYKQTTNPANLRGTLREAVTDVKVIAKNTDSTLAELYPRTGRTHQLRAHTSSIGHPIVGDIAYGSRKESERIMLHCSSITCRLRGEKRTFVSLARFP
jgi:23S rRNA pseudouridine1911/1915/1917 synthase